MVIYPKGAAQPRSVVAKMRSGKSVRLIRPLTSIITALACFLLTLTTNVLAKDEEQESSHDAQQQQQQQCDLYLAPSSTSEPNLVRLGIYAGRKYDANSLIGTSELAVQLLDVDAHNGRTLPDTKDTSNDNEKDNKDKDAQEVKEKKKEPNYFGVASEMLWTPDSTGAKYDTDESVGGPGQTFTSIPGIGMSGNFHAGLINADWDENSTLFRTVMEDDEGGMGVVHPGRGAVTDYYNITVAATQTIPPGMEIFLNFGQDWSAKALEKNPMATRTDYKRADEAVARIIDFFNKHEDNLTPETKAEMYSFLRKDVVKLSSESDVKANIMRSLMPETPDALQEFKDGGGSLRHKNPDVFRDLNWLRENGRCLDALRAGPSTIPHAGRGAFATRDIAKGEVVAPIPLMQIGHRKELDIYELVKQMEANGEEVYVRKDGKDAKPISSQLLINYCFGHGESDILLLGFGVASNFINHQPGKDANAKIVWSKSADGMHHPEWLELDPDVLSDDKHKYVGLMFDLVATKTIKKGDEVFVDYGEDWQKEWDKHVKRVEKVKLEAGSWIPSALELNTVYHHHQPGKGFAKKFKTLEEVKEDPYPERVMTACATQMKDTPENDPQRYIDGVKVFDWDNIGGKLVWQGISSRLCDVVERIEIKDEDDNGAKSYNYTVRVHLELDGDASSDYKIMRKVPHLAVRFVDRPYKSDQIRKDAPFPPFRHHIGIPDDIMPSAWKNKQDEK